MRKLATLNGGTPENGESIMITLTIREIKDLAELSGFYLVPDHQPTDTDMDTEITIDKCPPGGLLGDEEPITRHHYRMIAYLTECKEEGAQGLGAALAVDTSYFGVLPRAAGISPAVPNIPPDDELIKHVVEHVISRKSHIQPRWAALMDVFGQGSSAAYALCNRFGIDPDVYVPYVE